MAGPSPSLAAAFLVALALAFPPGGAAATEACLTMAEQRAAIRSGEAVRPASVRRTVGGEVLRLSLCRSNGRLVYRVVVLRRDGRVSSHVVDAASGDLMR